jgi:cytidine deaminase
LWTLATFSVSSSIQCQQGFLGGGSARRKAATYTQNNTNTEYMHTDIHVSSGIQTHNLSVQVGEDSSCLRPCGHCDQQLNHQDALNKFQYFVDYDYDNHLDSVSKL